MMFFPYFMGYAETHYKFRLPWSRIDVPWPELLVDGPHRVNAGEELPLWIVVRDADQFPIRLHQIQLLWRGPQGQIFQEELEFDLCMDGAFGFFPLAFTPPTWKGITTLHVRIDAERLHAQHLRPIRRIFEEWTYPVPAIPLQIHFLEYALPKLPAYLHGETHCHSWHSSDPVEFGAPPAILQEAAQCVGLDFIWITDHSYDFAFQQANYRKAADPQKRWADFQNECNACAPRPLLIAGEEVSCENAQGKNVHLLVPGHAEFIPGIGDSGRQWLKNHSEFKIPEVLKRLRVPAFAAHPQHPMGWLERKIFNRGPYQAADMHSGILGLEFWNGARDKGFIEGRQFWISQLLQGKYLLPLAGNDAHGDLNRSTSVKIPLWKLRTARKRILGQAFTSLLSSANSPQQLWEDFSYAQQRATLYISDGPALAVQSDSPSQVKILALSNSDWGALQSLQVFWGTSAGEVQQNFAIQGYEIQQELEWMPNANYVRCECSTAQNHFALTAALQVPRKG